MGWHLLNKDYHNCILHPGLKLSDGLDDLGLSSKFWLPHLNKHLLHAEQVLMGTHSSSIKILGQVVARRRCLNGSTIAM